jgi:GGDEF domain-containing protein
MSFEVSANRGTESALMAIGLHRRAAGHVALVTVLSPVWSRVKSNLSQEFEEVPSGLALDAETRAYNEAAFTYFLDIERRRSERSDRPFMLLLADFGTRTGADARMDETVATSVLSGLSRCLRDTDFVGWYLHEQVAGAVLTERAPLQDEKGVLDLCERVTQALRDRLPEALAGRLQVRVYHQLPAKDRES